MARSLLKDMQLPSFLWGEAVRHSVYLLNRLPTRALSEQTPYEAWTGVKPSLGYIRVFGCTAYMKVPNVHLKKLDDRSKPVINLGREPGTKAYRLFDPETKQVHVSRDVVFDEKKIWPWSQQNEKISLVQQGYFTVPGFDIEEKELSDETRDFGTPNSANKSINTYADVQSMSGSVSMSGTASTTETSNIENSETNSEPRKFRLLDDIYNDAEEVELEEELCLLGVDEPVNYEQACKQKEWRLSLIHI